MKDMIGYCGLDCEKCDAYIATVNDDQTLREKTAKLWAKLNNAPILPERRTGQYGFRTASFVVRSGSVAYCVDRTETSDESNFPDFSGRGNPFSGRKRE